MHIGCSINNFFKEEWRGKATFLAPYINNTLDDGGGRCENSVGVGGRVRDEKYCCGKKSEIKNIKLRGHYERNGVEQGSKIALC